MFEAAPKALDKHIVQPTSLAIHVDLGVMIFEYIREIFAGKLTTLAIVKDIRCAMGCQGFSSTSTQGAASRLLGKRHARTFLERGSPSPIELVHPDILETGGPQMARKTYKPEEIVAKLRKIDVLHSQGITMAEPVRQYGHYGYRRIAALLRDAGWQVNDKQIERLWRREGLKVPCKQPKRGRLCLNDGSCVRLRPQYRDQVWSYDFVHHRTDDGRASRTLNIIDEYGRECLAIRVKRRLNSTDVIELLTDLFIIRGIPACI